MISAGIDAAFNESLNILGYDKKVTYFYVFTGAALIITSAVGWIAAQTKSESLSFLVSFQHIT